MELSFSEVAVLSAAGKTPKTRTELAQTAARLYQSTKYDAALALVDIKTLEERRFLTKTKAGLLELSREGWAVVVQSLPIIENLRAAVSSVGYRMFGQ